MGEERLRQIVQEILSPAGIRLNGDRPWDIRINNERFYQRVLAAGSLGLGESYMDGWWECERLDEFFSRIMTIRPEEKIKKNLRLLLQGIRAFVFNLGGRSRAFEVGERHYDLGNDLYRCMLDRRMIYSCAYWRAADSLDDAQEAKLDLICRKVGLKQGDRVLDIGCGWGGFAGYAAEKYGAEVTGITVSKEQVALAGELCAGLPVEIRLLDYRDVRGKFDHVVSVGMFEHVGYKNYRTYMEVVNRCLKDDGLFLLHTIGNASSCFSVDPWIGQYIFPNSMNPSLKQISTAAEKLFVIEDIHNFGYYYDATLTSWFNNFNASWERLKERYDDRFYRMWKYYLLSSAGTSRCRDIQVWQIVLSKKGVPGGYSGIR
jgi:cyclopropane-fatty-acyl-phospholipid synthase